MYKYNCFIIHQIPMSLLSFSSTILNDPFLRIFKIKKYVLGDKTI